MIEHPVTGLLAFDLVNDEDQPVGHVGLGDRQCISLSIRNTSAGEIRFVTTGEPVSSSTFHFQLHFRPGVLRESFRKQLLEGRGDVTRSLDALGWSVHLDTDESTGDRISLLRQGTAAPPTRSHGGLSAGARLRLPLDAIELCPVAGDGLTQVQLAYARLQLADGTLLPPGSRVESLLILPFEPPGPPLDERIAQLEGDQTALEKWLDEEVGSPTKAPLYVREQSLMLPNDGGVWQCVLTIENMWFKNGSPARLDMGSEGHISLEVAPECELVGAEGYTAGGASGARTPWSVESSASTARLRPPKDRRHLEAGQTLQCKLELRTTHLATETWLIVRHEGLAEFGETRHRIPIHISPVSSSSTWPDRCAVTLRHDSDAVATYNLGDDELRVEGRRGTTVARFIGGVQADGITATGGGEGHPAALFKGGTGVRIDGVTGWKSGLEMEASADSSTAADSSHPAALSVHQKGAGPAAVFSGGVGVVVGGPLQITASSGPALIARPSGDASAAKLGGAVQISADGRSGLGVVQSGAGDTAWFDVDQVRIYRTGNNAAPALAVESATPGGFVLDVGLTGEDGQIKLSDALVADFHGAICTGAVSTFSDARLKEDILPLQSSLEQVLALRGVSFSWKGDPTEKPSYGFIAQEVETVFPDLVSDGADGRKSISTTSILPLLLEALRELRARHREQSGRIQQITRRIAELEEQALHDCLAQESK